MESLDVFVVIAYFAFGFYSWVVEVLYIFWKLTPYHIFTNVSSYSTNFFSIYKSLCRQKLFKFHIVSLVFVFVTCTFHVVPMKSFPIAMSQWFPLMCSSRNFSVSGLMFKFFIHFEVFYFCIWYKNDLIIFFCVCNRRHLLIGYFLLSIFCQRSSGIYAWIYIYAFYCFIVVSDC